MMNIQGFRRYAEALGKFATTFLLALLTQPAFAAAPQTVTYYYTDPQGTVLATADAQGNILTQADRRPYGEQVMGTPQDGPGYTGHVDDPDSGLIYMQARYYDPAVGRFISIDPLPLGVGDVFGVGRYVYGSNNPIVRSDPTGMSDECSAACIKMRQLSDSMGVSGAFRGNTSGASGLMGRANAVGNTLNSELELAAAGEVSAAAGSVDAIPGATAAACISGAPCSTKDIIFSIATIIPPELEIGEAFEIMSINRQFSSEGLGNGRFAETVIANMSYRGTLMEQAAVAIRDIAGGHLFRNGNKRTALVYAERILGGSVDSSRLSSVVYAAADGRLRTIEDIMTALQAK